MEIKVFSTTAQLFNAAALFIIETADKAIEENGRFVISLSGGHTPAQLFTLLSTPPYCTQMQWKKTFVFWGDERCVPSNDEQNNAHMAKSLLLEKVDMPAANIFPVAVDLPPAKAALDYEKKIKDFFGEDLPRFDVTLLGLGEDGHTASIFPGNKMLGWESGLVKEVYQDEQKMFRISMTPYLLNLSHNILFLVTGNAKAEILEKVLAGAYQPGKYPAQLIKPSDGKLLWFIDKESASVLPSSLLQQAR